MARTKKKLSKQEKLERLQAKLENVDTGGNRGSFWQPVEGKNKIRILPEVGDMDFFFVEVGTHQFGDWKNGTRVYCPSFSTNGEEDCPICDRVNDLYRSGDKDLANDIRVNRKYWMNIIDRNDEAKGPQVFTAGPMIFGFLKSYINDPDYGDITDEYDGADVIIDRVGTGMDTDYVVKIARNDSPLSEDEDQMDQWFDAAKDLTVVLLDEDPETDKELIEGKHVWVLPYDRILDDYILDELIYNNGQSGGDDELDDDEPEEEEAPKRSARRERRSRRKSR